MTTPDRPFSLRVAGIPHDLEVTRLRGREPLCGLYGFTLRVVTSRRLVAGGRALLGRAATLTLVTSDGATRRVHGVVTEQRVGAHDASHELRVLRLRVEPRMALLRHRVRSRVFHDLTPAAVVATVLREWGIHPEGRFARVAPRLEHCVQRRESDLAFVTRVLARHGLSWWFEHPHEAGEAEVEDTRADLEGATVVGDGDLGDSGLGRERVILCDVAERYSALGGGAEPRTLRYVTTDGDDAAPEDVTRFTADDRLRPTAAAVTRHEPARHRPEGATYVTDRLAFRDVHTTEGALGLSVERFDAEHGPAVEPGSARALLEAVRRDAARCVGRCGLPDVAPGQRFTLADHACPELDGDYVVTEALHRGDVRGASRGYRNVFVCAPASVLVRPPLPSAPHGMGVESATVVGDVADDVHTDGDGRVRVRFHWDTRDATPEERSCKVRVATPWSGDAWGTQFTPRVGREVLVAFLDDDVDQPVVVGALHNGHDSAPFPVGQDTRRSGIRTNSIGGDGYNELSFEDLAGREELYLRAQRNLREEVRHDRVAHVRGSDAATVGGNVTAHVGGAVRVTVDNHGREGGQGVVLTTCGELFVKSSNMLSLASPQSISLVCGNARLQMTPDAITLGVGDRVISIRGEGNPAPGADLAREQSDSILLVAPKIWHTSEEEIDLQAPRINLNSRGAR